MLKLQKVEMLGFKSFADATHIEFHGQGVAAVVGPNGCGKSNISDAIHWVLGEQSAKTLRSSKMQDVLFSGTPSRKATGLAEVKLTLIDPEAKALAATIPMIAPVANSPAIAEGYSEEADGEAGSMVAKRKHDGIITVARRLFASGESEYLMDDRPCRLRDIQELFLGTGLGPDSYAIIEQGRIGQILSAKPYERRALIEEAAGVTKFKAKRKLAWARLESSKQNLARVSDILEEVTRQVNSLQRQAAKARRYKELYEQVRAQLRGILVSKQRLKDEEASGLALELGMLRRAIEEQAAQIEAEERAQQEAHAELERQQTQLRESAQQRSNLQLAAERARGQVASQAQQIQSLERRSDETAAEQLQLQDRAGTLEAERALCAGALAEIEAERDSLLARLRDWERRSGQCQSELAQREARLEQIRAEMLDAVGECATLRNQVTQIEQFITRTGSQIAHSENQAAELESLLHAAAARRRETGERVGVQRGAHDELASRQRSLEERLRNQRELEAQTRAELEHSRTQLASARARLLSLEEILDRHSYATETVQRLFDWKPSADIAEAAHGRLESSAVLADFLEVEPAYERVVEEFLREELDYLVVSNWEAAQRGVQLLRSEVPGRATFLLYDRLDPAAEGSPAGAEDELGADTPGILRPLKSCVRFLNVFENAPAGLLPKLNSCYLVEDASAGRRLARQYPQKYFLTPEGIWFQGALVSAGKTDSQGPLALKREMRGLARAVEEREAASERLAASLQVILESIGQVDAELNDVALKERESERACMHAERDLREAAGDEERAAGRMELAALDLTRLRMEADRAREQWTADTQAITAREKSRTDLEQENTALTEAAAQLRQAGAEARAVEGDLRGRLAALEERRRSSSSAVERLSQSLGELERRRGELAQQVEIWKSQRVEMEQDNRRLEEEIAQAAARCDMLARCIDDLQSASAAGRERLAARDQRLHQERQEMELAREKRTESEVQLARLQSELEHLNETCRNELQVELETLMAEDLPVLRAEELLAAEESWRQLRAKLENLGPINMMALEEYEECKQRHLFLDQQRQDLLDAIRDATQAIQEIDEICNRQFSEALEQIGVHFQATFAQLFGGGQGMLRLLQSEEPNDAAKDSSEAGIEIVAQPPGKRLQSVLLLSGGEKALTAMALLLAIFRYRPSPFCILDEVDAPLDDANIGRFTQMVTEMSRDTQFILITHSKKTMSIASVLYGVTMQEPGVSKIVSVRFHQHSIPAPPTPRLLAEAVA